MMTAAEINPGRPAHATRKAWRAAIARERAAVRSGDWGPRRGQRVHRPDAPGWLRDVKAAVANDLYVVLLRVFELDGVGEMRHLAIRTASGLEPPWRDLQRIKNELCGDDRYAVQVCPPADQLVDGADMYHLWAYPSGYRPPFSLATA